MNIQETLRKNIVESKEELVSALAGLVAIPSVSEDKEQVDKALRYILNLAKDMGFETKAAAGGKVGVISMGEGPETLGILAHVDVVPPGEIDQWETDPYTLTEKDGRLYGRGTQDDKGPAMAALFAMKAIKDCGQPIYKKVQLILGTQEEVEWTDMEAYVEEEKDHLPDYGFTPDGEFPLCNVEKGCIDLLLQFPLDSQVGAADGVYLTDIQAGTAANSIPGSCTAKLARIENGRPVSEETIEVAGKSAHSCMPENGENALLMMAKRLGEENLQENRLFCISQWILEKLEDMNGAAMGISSESEYFDGEFVHRNVLSPTMAYIKDGFLYVTVNIRFAYGSDPEMIVEAFRKETEKAGGQVKEAEVMPAVFAAKTRPYIEAFAKAYEEGSGRKHEFALEHGGTYAKAMPNIVSWGPIFPDEEDSCHQENEYINTQTLLDNGKIFVTAMAKIVLSEESFQ